MLILLSCEAASLTVFTTMCPEEQQTSNYLMVKDYCFIIEIFDKFTFKVTEDSFRIHKLEYY